MELLASHASSILFVFQKLISFISAADEKASTQAWKSILNIPFIILGRCVGCFAKQVEYLWRCGVLQLPLINARSDILCLVNIYYRKMYKKTFFCSWVTREITVQAWFSRMIEYARKRIKYFHFPNETRTFFRLLAIIDIWGVIAKWCDVTWSLSFSELIGTL